MEGGTTATVGLFPYCHVKGWVFSLPVSHVFLLALSQHSSHNSFWQKALRQERSPLTEQKHLRSTRPGTRLRCPRQCWKQIFLFTEALERFPPCSGHSLNSCRQDRAAVPRRSISLESLLLPTPSLQEPAQVLHSKVLIYGINKTSPKQINQDYCLQRLCN